MTDVNFELQMIADAEKIEIIQAQYDELYNDIMAEYKIRLEASESYDEDCMAY